MSGPIKVFFCEPIGDVIVTESFRCPAGHDTEAALGRMPSDAWSNDKDAWDRTMPCGECGATAKMSTRGGRTIYRRVDTGEEIGGYAGLPPGAVYEVDHRPGPDGRSLAAVCPDGRRWWIDSRASNCTMKDDDVHRCWCRHGRPEDGDLTVDKNGHTCAAGGGSIDTGTYHGFLQNGFFT